MKLNGKKINYHDFITSRRYEECNRALSRIVPRIDIGKICTFIDAVDEISDLQRRFYKRYLTGRYEKILVPAFR